MRRVLLLLTLLLCSCDVLGPDASPFAEPRYYANPVFGSREACEAAQEPGGFWMNCDQIAVFCPDGTAEFVVTDIVNHARYEIRGDQLTMRFPEPGEVSGRVVFKVSADRERLTELRTGTVWERRPDREDEATRYACD
jgi:hypothetical protein